MENVSKSYDFEVPRNSFTGFRLLYLDTQQISTSSKCVLLGTVPHIWLVDDTPRPGIIEGRIRRIKGDTKKRFDSTLSYIYNSVYKDPARRGRSLNFLLKDSKKVDKIINDIKVSYLDQDSSDVESLADESYKGQDFFGANESLIYKEPPSNYNLDDDTSIEEPNLNVPKSNQNLDSSTTSVDHQFFSDSSQNNLSPPSVKFIDDQKHLHRRQILMATPEPVTEDFDKFTLIDKKHKGFRDGLKTLAKVSRRRAKITKNDFRIRVFRSIMKTFKAGEIILQDKGLTLSKEAWNVSKVVGFDENETYDSNVYEQWKEYIIVLRKTSDVGNCITLQFYKPHDGELHKPEYLYDLNENVTSNLYSNLDKTLSISISKSKGVLIHMINFHNHNKSLRWLYFIKQALGDPLNEVFNINVPEINLQLEISIPEEIIIEAIEAFKDVQLSILANGYKVRYTPLIQYILDKIQEISQNNHIIEQWLKENSSPWFCFKDYDRLEWISDDSEIFYIQNQLLKQKFNLELRNMHNLINDVSLSGKHLSEPLPIEGFLCRLTDVKGEEVSMLRTFYKVLYFYSSNNLLFFSKYYRGLPPSPDNILLHEKLDHDTIQEKIPSVYEHCSYMLDDNDHIEWLHNKDKFTIYDKRAFEEFERRSQLVTKADSVIDLTSILDIKPVDLKDIKLPHKLFLCLLWHKCPNFIEDDFIMDSVFEITTINGGNIKLQAPDRDIRDEWIKRLIEMKDYWVTRKQLDVQEIEHVRSKNQEILNIEEYVDSCINQEAGYNEKKHSVADTLVYNTNSLSLRNELTFNGYLYQKYKKHSNFSQYYVILSSGNLVLYSLYKRSRVTGEWKRALYFQHYLTISLENCYIYSGIQTSLDLLDRNKVINPADPTNKSLPRVYYDGWKSSEEESMRCFTLWFGRKRSISKRSNKEDDAKNPNLVSVIRKLGITGQSIVFMARSRQERELWVSKIYSEIERNVRLYGR